MPRFVSQWPRPLDSVVQTSDELVAKERELLDASSQDCRTGIALSGGGIRAATFALGVLQAFAASRRERPNRG